MSDTSHRSPDERLVEALHEAWGDLWLQADAYLARFAARLSPGLSRDGIDVLFALRRYGPMTPADLAATRGLTPSAVDQRLTDLLARGLVRREGDVVRLDETTVEHLELAVDERIGRIRDSLMTWPAEERYTFVRLLSRFAQRDDLVAGVALLGLHRTH